MALNCAAIPENLLESELFGHEKGSFTGADRRRIGKFEQCNNGTILLDEIGDMPLALAGKDSPPAAGTIIRASWRQRDGADQRAPDRRQPPRPEGAFAEGKFRADLYYRLSVFSIHLPPLRERDEDLAMLVHYYLRRFSRELGREVLTIDPEALARLRAYHWPGNIRELQSVVKQALLQSRGSVLLPSFLPELSVAPAERCPSAAQHRA
jgi:transcriptional regulator with PAS, ATPase and Fis domain